MRIKKETIIRTIVLAVALINQVLITSGKSQLPYADEELAEMLSTLFTIGASIWAWWKNNSVTQKALMADEYLLELKLEDK